MTHHSRPTKGIPVYSRLVGAAMALIPTVSGPVLPAKYPAPGDLAAGHWCGLVNADVAQLVERPVCRREAVSAILAISTTSSALADGVNYLLLLFVPYLPGLAAGVFCA